MTGAGERDDEISEEARLLAEQVRHRAEAMPTEADVTALADSALTNSGSPMTPAEIRNLAAEALAKAQQVSSLLGRLATLLEERPGRA